LIVGLLVCAATALGQSEAREKKLREVVISYAPAGEKMQLYRVKEDGSDRQRITDSRHDCMQPAWSPDGEKIAYVRQNEQGLDLWLCDPDGKNAKPLTRSGRNLLPSWLPDSRHLVWMVSKPGGDPAHDSQIHLMNTKTGVSRRLFADGEQIKFSNAMPAVSPKGNQVAFVSNRSGHYRVWVANMDGSDAKAISPLDREEHPTLELPLEQKVPAWSPDGKLIAHWQGVEMTHMSRFTGKPDGERDEQISQTWLVWTVGADGKNKRKMGWGDDPTWSPDGFVTRAFPDPKRGGPRIMIDSQAGWADLSIIPEKTPRYGRFAWKP
jgi:TolB protein